MDVQNHVWLNTVSGKNGQYVMLHAAKVSKSVVESIQAMETVQKNRINDKGGAVYRLINVFEFKVSYSCSTKYISTV